MESSISGRLTLVTKRLTNSMHVLLAIAADVVDVDIEHVGIFFDLAPGNATRPSQSSLLSSSRTFLEPLALSRSPMIKGVVLVIGRRAVNRGSRGFRPSKGRFLCLRRAHCALRWGHLLGQLSQGDMGWRGAAAATNHLNPEVFDEVVHRHLHLHWSEAVMGHTATFSGRPALGMQLTTKGACALR